MFEALYSIITSICFGLGSTISKKTISENGLYRAIVYNYVFVALLLIVGAIFFHQSLSFPSTLVFPYLIEILIGAVAVIALFRAFEIGKASVLGPLSMLYVLVVLFGAIVFFGENVSQYLMAGCLLLISSSLFLSFENLRKFKLESGVALLLVTIFGWGYYYSAMKIFVPVLGAYMTTFYLEIGIGIIVSTYAILSKKDVSPPKSSDSIEIFFRSGLLFLGSLLYSASVGNIGVGLTSAIVSSSSLVTAISSYFMLKEKLDFSKYLAMFISIIGLVLIFLG